MDAAQAINRFWNGFGVRAYDSNTVPEGAAYPRLTYDYTESEFNDPTIMSASLWYHSMSWEDITTKADEISRAIGLGGHMEPYDNGAIWITRGSPFIQRMSDQDPTIRRIVLSVYADYLSND